MVALGGAVPRLEGVTDLLGKVDISVAVVGGADEVLGAGVVVVMITVGEVVDVETGVAEGSTLIPSSATARSLSVPGFAVVGTS